MPEKPRSRGGKQHQQHTRYDQRMFNAKNNSFPVRFTLDCETKDTNEDCEITGTIVEVDKFDVLIRLLDEAQLISGEDRSIWLKKWHIVSTEVLV